MQVSESNIIISDYTLESSETIPVAYEEFGRERSKRKTLKKWYVN